MPLCQSQEEPLSAREARWKRLTLLLALFLSALALRPQVIGVGPLLPRIHAEMGSPHGILGLLATIPVLCMGVFAPVAAFVSGRLGPRIAVAASLVAVGAAGLARAVSGDTASLLLATLAVGIPTGVGGALLPVAVKQWFRSRPVAATGVYATGIQLGATGAAFSAVPLVHLTGSWRGALAAFSVVGLALAAMWFALTRGQTDKPAVWSRPPRLPLTSGVAWLLAAVFFLQAVPYHALNTWLPAYLLEVEWSEVSAGALQALLNIGALTGTLLVPLVADRRGSRRQYLLAGTGLMTVGIVGLLLQPSAAPLWAATTGLGLGTCFPMSLTLPLDVSDSPATAGATAGFMLGVGYGATAVAPSALGFIRDATGSFTASLWLLVGTCAVLALCVAALSPRRLNRGIRARGFVSPAPPP